MSEQKKSTKNQSSSLQNLFVKIRKEAEKEVDNNRKKAKKKLEEIEKETNDLVKKIQKQELDKEVNRLDFIRKRTETEFQQEARRIEIQSKEKLIDEVYERVEKEFDDFRKHKKYKLYLEKTLESTLESMRVREMKILADKKDVGILKDIVKKISEKKDVKFQIEASILKTSGGFVITDVEERVRINYTIENLMQSSREKIRTKINELLFK